MNRSLAGILASLSLALPLSAQRGNPEVSFAGEEVDQMIAAYMKEYNMPGMAVAIVQAPDITRVTPSAAKAPLKELLQHRSPLPRTLDYTLPAEVITKISGVPCGQFLRENQLDRMGLKQTFHAGERDAIQSLS